MFGVFLVLSWWFRVGVGVSRCVGVWKGIGISKWVFSWWEFLGSRCWGDFLGFGFFN